MLRAPALKADALLLLTAAIWGFAFVAQRAGMEHVGPFTFNGVRFLLGSASLLPLVARRARTCAAPAAGSGRGTFAAGAVLGLVLFGGASLQQVGIVYTTAGKAGFITGLYVVIVPLLGLGLGHRVRAAGWAGVALATAGMALLSVRGDLTLAPGDGLVLLSAVFWAVHVLVIGRYARRFDAIRLAAVQFAICGLLSLAVALAIEPLAPGAILAAAVPILYGGLASVGIAYTLQIVAQRDAQPTVAAILLSLESVFAALGGFLLLGERLDPRGALGCGLMLAGAIAAQFADGAIEVERAEAG